MDVLVIACVEMHRGENVVAILHLILIGQMETIGTHDEQIIRGLDRQEAHTVHAYAGCTVE